MKTTVVLQSQIIKASVQKYSSCFLLLLASCGLASSTPIGADGNPLNAMAPLYFTMSGTSRQIAARLALPMMTANHGWYCNWIMLVGNDATSGKVEFIQAGEIRRPKQFGGERSFVAWLGPLDIQIQYKEFQDLPDASHFFELNDENGQFSLAIDLRKVTIIPETIRLNKEYAQVGPEVSLEGDHLSGIVFLPVKVSGRDFGKAQLLNICRLVNRGVTLVQRDNQFIGSGVFSEAATIYFKGNCKALKQSR